MKRIAIVGFGGAGYCAAKAAREYDPEAFIDVYNDTGVGPYNPMLTTYYAKADIDYNGMFPFGQLDEIAQRLRLCPHPDTTVKSLDAGRRILGLADGSEAAYDGIVLSTGASAFVPPIPGAQLPGVFTMRTYKDAMRLKEALAAGNIRSGLVIGASWVGIKVVEDFDAFGVACTLVDGADRIFPIATFEKTARRIQADLEGSGVALSFGQMLSRIERDKDGRLAAVMKGEDRFVADAIAVCIGVRPNTALAREAGLAVNRGILVDERMRTSVPGIYAAGDCCEAPELQSGERRNIGVWMNAQRQGATAGANIVGIPAVCASDIVLNLAHYMGRDFVSIGDIKTCMPEDEIYEYEDSRIYIRAVKGGGKIRCVNLISAIDSAGIVKHAMIRAFGGGSAGFDARAFCLMRDKGIPDSFIKFMGGISID
ncbi:MAG: NAD(P)/FAD-dependent oxidoreductase [Clostridia bacterium]|nr:NAD(P)/FAD-dependent oxidoreductase [Clostridia bacterium]